MALQKVTGRQTGVPFILTYLFIYSCTPAFIPSTNVPPMPTRPGPCSWDHRGEWGSGPALRSHSGAEETDPNIKSAPSACSRALLNMHHALLLIALFFLKIS